jgi:hypothetical protein
MNAQVPAALEDHLSDFSKARDSLPSRSILSHIFTNLIWKFISTDKAAQNTYINLFITAIKGSNQDDFQ